jgi:hypothetical protein
MLFLLHCFKIGIVVVFKYFILVVKKFATFIFYSRKVIQNEGNEESCLISLIIS